jgi:acetylornithine deacetylase
MTVCLGHYGYLEVLLRTHGKRAHSSMPELGQNAIESMLKLMLRVTDYATTGTEGLVYNIRELSGFPSGFVVPDTCEAYVDLHLPPHSQIDKLKTELEHIVEKAGKEIPGLDAVLRFEEARPGYRISNERLISQETAEDFPGNGGTVGTAGFPLPFRCQYPLVGRGGPDYPGAGTTGRSAHAGRIRQFRTSAESGRDLFEFRAEFVVHI